MGFVFLFCLEAAESRLLTELCHGKENCEYLILSVLSRGAHTQKHTGVCTPSLTHCPHTHARAHTRSHPPLGGGHRGARSDSTRAGTRRLAAWCATLGWVSSQLCLVVLVSTAVLGKPPQRWGGLRRNVRHTSLGRKEEIHAPCSDASFREGRAFVFPLACSVSPGRGGEGWGEVGNHGKRKERRNKENEDNGKGY